MDAFVQQRQIARILLLFLLLSLCAASVFAAASSTVETAQPALSSETDIHSMLSSLSDEQVRRLLIEELKKDTTSSEGTIETDSGPSAFLNEMLSGLEGASTSTDGQAKALFQNLPSVLPDLYKVFVTL